MVRPLGAKPRLDAGHGIEQAFLEVQQRASESSGEVRNGHVASLRVFVAF
jgi:hypothetical protein